MVPISYPDPLQDYLVQKCNVTSRPNTDVWYDYGPNEPCDSPANDRWNYQHHTRVMYGVSGTKRFIGSMLASMGVPIDARHISKTLKGRVDDEVLAMRQTRQAMLKRGPVSSSIYPEPGQDPLDLLKRA